MDDLDTAAGRGNFWHGSHSAFLFAVSLLLFYPATTHSYYE